MVELRGAGEGGGGDGHRTDHTCQRKGAVCTLIPCGGQEKKTWSGTLQLCFYLTLVKGHQSLN